MLAEDFNAIFEAQIHRVESVLGDKGEEYATEDRLHNFKRAADMQGVSMKEALGGMMAKHTISIYDMIGDNKTHSLEKWDEKITDHINYLFLLAAVIREEDHIDAPMIPSIYPEAYMPQDVPTPPIPYFPTARHAEDDATKEMRVESPNQGSSTANAREYRDTEVSFSKDRPVM